MILKFPPSVSGPTRVGISGTGFIAQSLSRLLRSMPEYSVSRVLTRRKHVPPGLFPAEVMTRSVEDLVENSEVIVEASGDPRHAFKVVEAAFSAALPVVTMNAEFQVTLGSHFVGHGYLTEAEGDQPGCLAALHEEAVSMGFKPLVYGNIKGFLNHNPSRQEMEYWAERQGISVPKVTSFTDGTKVQIEQALVANGLRADIVRQGMLGLQNLPMAEAGPQFARMARNLGTPISDYVLNATLPAGVFLVAEHPVELASNLRYMKLGDGPYYTLLRPYHLCHMEIPRTIRRAIQGREVLLDNSARPQITIAPIAKCDLKAGHKIKLGIGGWSVRGEAVRWRDAPDLAPMGLLSGAKLARRVPKGATLSLEDVELPDDSSLQAWWKIRQRALAVPLQPNHGRESRVEAAG